MLILKVNDGTDDFFLDLYENDPVNLKFQYSDITEIQKAAGTYSQTFRIPATQANVDFFGTFFNANLTGGFNPKRKKDAELSYNTIPIASGFIQLKKVFIQKENYADFEVVFFGENVSLARTLGDKKLKDLDLSAFDHTVNYSNVTGSWTGGLFSGKVRYGLIDKGYVWSNLGQGQPINSNAPIYPGQFTPFLRVREIVQAIFDDNGFTLDSSFFSNAAFDTYYTPMFRGSQMISSDVPLSNERFVVGRQTDVAFSLNFLVGFGVNNAFEATLSEASPFSDNGNNFASNTFTPVGTGIHVISSNVTATLAAASGEGNIFALLVDDNNLPVANLGGTTIHSGETVTFGITTQVTLDGAATYKFIIDCDNSIIISGLTIEGNGYSNDGTWFRLDDVLSLDYGQTAHLESNAPDIKQIDYLTSLGKMFNLVFIPDKNNPLKITIEPFNDYVAGGAPKDWTPYIDYEKDVVISPTTDIQFKNYEWSYSEDKDYLNVFYKENANRIYGRYLIEDGENDFATGDYKVQPLFGAYPITYIDGTNVLIHKAIGSNGQIISDPKCKVVYWGGLQTNAQLWAYNEATNASVNLTSYPYFGHYSVPNPDVSNIDLNFGGEIPAHPIQANPYDNLYNVYWRQYVDQLYSSDSRLMEAYFHLTAADIADFEWKDSIFIKDSYWRVIELDYSPNSNDLVRCKLIKILADIRPCEWIPHQSNLNGTITFIDSNGVTGDPSQQCCEYFGYSFVGSKCYWSGSHQSGIVGKPTITQVNALTFGERHNGIGIMQGNDITSYEGNRFHIVSGNNISLEPIARNQVAIGSFIDVTYKDNILATGSYANAFVEGYHRGGGFYYNATETNGYGQMGMIPFLYEGDFDQGDEVELFIEGKQNNRLSIPDNSCFEIRMEVNITTQDGTTGDLSQSQTLVFFENFKKIAGVASAYYGTHANTPVHVLGDFGTATNKFHVDIDVTTNTSQHRIIFHNNSQTNTKNTRIICWIYYVMGQW